MRNQLLEGWLELRTPESKVYISVSIKVANGTHFCTLILGFYQDIPYRNERDDLCNNKIRLK